MTKDQEKIIIKKYVPRLHKIIDHLQVASLDKSNELIIFKNEKLIRRIIVNLSIIKVLDDYVTIKSRYGFLKLEGEAFCYY